MRRFFTFNYHILRKLHTKIGRVKYANFEHPTSDSGTTNYANFVRRQHCSSLCSQSVGNCHVAKMLKFAIGLL